MEFLDLLFMMSIKMNILLLVIIWDYSIIHWLGSTWNFYVASELKHLKDIVQKIQLFPGHYLTSKDGEFVQWYKRDWTEYDAVKENETNIQDIKVALEAAVHSN
jgi:asparagine synthetase B (glutamine-hydrolysing)